MEAEELQAIASGQRGKVVVHGLEARDALPLKNALTQAGASVRVLEVIVRHSYTHSVPFARWLTRTDDSTVASRTTVLVDCATSWQPIRRCRDSSSTYVGDRA